MARGWSSPARPVARSHLEPWRLLPAARRRQAQIDLTKHLKVQTTLGTGGTPATGITPETIPAAASVSLMGSNTSRLRCPLWGMKTSSRGQA
jgi:hypothetical protein